MNSCPAFEILRPCNSSLTPPHFEEGGFFCNSQCIWLTVTYWEGSSLGCGLCWVLTPHITVFSVLLEGAQDRFKTPSSPLCSFSLTLRSISQDKFIKIQILPPPTVKQLGLLQRVSTRLFEGKRATEQHQKCSTTDTVVWS